MRITVKAVGDHTARIGAIRPGTRVVAEGPFGVFTADAQRRDRSLLIAGGIGITPIRALLEELRGDTVVVYRILTPDDAVFTQELDGLAREHELSVHYVVGDHTAPGAEQLLSLEHLHELVPDLRRREIFLCGPPAMTEAIERTIRRARVPRRQIHIERFAL